MRFALTFLVFALSTVCSADVREITDARHHGNLERLLEMSEQTSAADFFETAYLNYALATTYLSQRDKELATKAANASLEALGRDAGANDSADSMALWAATIGLKISLRPMSGMRLGPQNQRVIQRAIDLDSKNPTVWLVRGIGLSNTPKMFGGGEDKALEALNKSLLLFGAKKPTERQWGYADAYVWRSRIYQKKGQMKKANADLESALTVAPGYLWPMQQLEALEPNSP